MNSNLDDIETVEEAEEILRDYKIEYMKGLLERYMKREGDLVQITDEHAERALDKIDHKPKDHDVVYDEVVLILKENGFYPESERPSVFMEGHFLEVQFHDNDFFYVFTEGLRLMWNFLEYRTDNVRKTLLKADPEAVKRTVLQFVVTADMNMPCLRDLGVEKHGGKLKPFEEQDPADSAKYFSGFDIEFHNSDRFTQTWENGEHFWINLHTGEVGSH